MKRNHLQGLLELVVLCLFTFQAKPLICFVNEINHAYIYNLFIYFCLNREHKTYFQLMWKEKGQDKEFTIVKREGNKSPSTQMGATILLKL